MKTTKEEQAKFSSQKEELERKLNEAEVRLASLENIIKESFADSMIKEVQRV